MLRWLGTVVIALLFVLNLLLPLTPIGRRGTEAALRSDLPDAVVATGEPLPDFTLEDLDGAKVRLADFRGHPALITFERSVDW
jgi:cytochrome oxidase Cu insertion factor (SCO1/SenC/PrrC family)